MRLRVTGLRAMKCPSSVSALQRDLGEDVVARLPSTRLALASWALSPGCISSEPTFAGLRKNQKKEKKGPKKRGPRKKGKRGFLWQKLTSLEMQPGAKLRRISRGHYFAATRLHAAF